MTMTSRTYYETGIETPEILGSGSSLTGREGLSGGTKNRNVGEHERLILCMR